MNLFHIKHLQTNFSDAVAHTVYRKPSFLLSASEELKSVEEHQLFVPVTLS